MPTYGTNLLVSSSCRIVSMLTFTTALTLRQSASLSLPFVGLIPHERCLMLLSSLHHLLRLQPSL